MNSLQPLSRRLTLLVASGLHAMALGVAQAQPASAPAMGHGSSSMHGGTGSMDMHGSMMRGMEAMQQMKPTGDADRDFATMMKMHHQQAVEMSQAYLKQGKSPEMRRMAEKIIGDQQKEIAQFDKWLQSRK